MLLALLMLMGQRPLVLDSPRQTVGGNFPHIRVTLPGTQEVATLEYEGWVETALGNAQAESLDLNLVKTNGFELTRLPTLDNRIRIRASQTGVGPLEFPTPALKWKMPGSGWEEFTWNDFLRLKAEHSSAGPGAGHVSQPKITVTTLLIALGIIATTCVVIVLLFPGRPALVRLLENPETSNKEYWNIVYTEWRLELAKLIPIQPGSTPRDYGRLWEEAGFADPDTVLQLGLELERFRFQTHAPDLGEREEWIRKARGWMRRKS